MEDELAPARGLISGILLSIPLWGIIAAFVYWIL